MLSAAESTAAGSSATAPFSTLSVPPNLGSIRERSAGLSAKTIILIQDAHSIPEAQVSIRGLIDHFTEIFGVSLVAVEGARSELDPTLFQAFPGKDELTNVFAGYLERGELTGASAAALFSSGRARFFGLEDWALYEEGLSLYLAASEKKEADVRSLSQARKKLEAEKEDVYSPGLLAVDRASTLFHEDSRRIVEVLQTLSKTRAPEPGTELAALLKESLREEISSGAALEIKKEIQRVEPHLRSLPSSSEAGRINGVFQEKLQDFRTSRIPASEFVLYLSELAVAGEARFKGSLELEKLMDTARRIRDIEGSSLVLEFDEYVEEIKESLFRNDEERRLDRESGELAIAAKMTRFELNREDWEDAEAGVELKEAYPVHAAFYANAEAREDFFFRHMENLMEKHEARTALMITGGFHTRGLIERFKEKGISYLLVTPAIAALPGQESYSEHMKGSVSWKSYFAAENGRINLYKAFVRAARDTLLEASAQPRGTLLKSWRDSLIRILSREGRLSEAHDYICFLDEAAAAGNPSGAVSNARINSFLQGLSRLQEDGRVTGQNIMQLVTPATMLAPITGIDPAMSLPASFAQGRMPVYRSEVRPGDQTSASDDPLKGAENFGLVQPGNYRAAPVDRVNLAEALNSAGIDPAQFTTLVYLGSGNGDGYLMGTLRRIFPNLDEYHLDSMSYSTRIYGPGNQAAALVVKDLQRALDEPDRGKVEVLTYEDDYAEVDLKFKRGGRRVFIDKFPIFTNVQPEDPDFNARAIRKGMIRAGDIVLRVPRPTLKEIYWKKQHATGITVSLADSWRNWQLYEVTQEDISAVKEKDSGSHSGLVSRSELRKPQTEEDEKSQRRNEFLHLITEGAGISPDQEPVFRLSGSPSLKKAADGSLEEVNYTEIPLDEKKIVELLNDQSLAFLFDNWPETEEGDLQQVLLRLRADLYRPQTREKIMDIRKVSFPSPWKDSVDENSNLIHAYWFVPKKEGPVPVVVIPSFVKGDLFARALSIYLPAKGIAVLEMHLPIYGERTPFGASSMGSSGRYQYLDFDAVKFRNYVLQSVTDGMTAVRWARAQGQVDRARVSVGGYSKAGSIAQSIYLIDPMVSSAVTALPVADYATLIWSGDRYTPFVNSLSAAGISRDMFAETTGPVSPRALADIFKRDASGSIFGAAVNDELVPIADSRALAAALGITDHYFEVEGDAEGPHLTGLVKLVPDFLSRLIEANASARSELRSDPRGRNWKAGAPDLRSGFFLTPDDYRKDIRRGLGWRPEYVKEPYKLSAHDANARIDGFFQAILEAGMKDFFNFEYYPGKLRKYSDYAMETVVRLEDGSPLTITTLPTGVFDASGSAQSIRNGFHVFTLTPDGSNKPVVVGYNLFTVHQGQDEPLRIEIGLDIFRKFRAGEPGPLTVSSRQILENSLRFFDEYYKPDSFYVSVAGQLRDSVVGSAVQNAIFYLRQGFYPPGHKADADRLLEKIISGERLKEADVDRFLIVSHPPPDAPNEFWEFQMNEDSRSELRDPEDYRKEIRERIAAGPSYTRLPRVLGEEEAQKAIDTFEKAVVDAGLNDFYDWKSHPEEMRAHRKMALESTVTLNDGRELIITTLPTEPFPPESLPASYERGFHVYSMKTEEGDSPVILGYSIYSVEKSEGRVTRVELGFDVFPQFRAGIPDRPVSVRSRELYEESLKILNSKYAPESFEIDRETQIADSSVGKARLSAAFYVRQGFYPPAGVELVDPYLQIMLEGDRLEDEELDELLSDTEPAAGLRNPWIFPMKVLGAQREIKTAGESVKKDFDASSEPFLEELVRDVGSVDAVITIPVYNEIPGSAQNHGASLPGTHGQTIDARKLAQDIKKSVEAYLAASGGQRALILVSGETRGAMAQETLAALRAIAPSMESNQIRFRVYGKEERFAGFLGKKWSLRLGMQAAARLGGHFATIDADMAIDSDYAAQMLGPLRGSAQYVSPVYTRYWARDDAALIALFGFPFFSAVFGKKIRMPNEGGFAAAHSQLPNLLGQEALWDNVTLYESQFAGAVRGSGGTLAEAWLGEKRHKTNPLFATADAYVKFAVLAMFSLLDSHRDWWQPGASNAFIEGIEAASFPVPELERTAQEIVLEGVDPVRWIELFQQGYASQREAYKAISPGFVPLLERLEAADPDSFGISSREWAEVVFGYFKLYLESSDKTVRSLIPKLIQPFFAARAAGYMKEVSSSKSFGEAEDLLITQAKDFAAEKARVFAAEKRSELRDVPGDPDFDRLSAAIKAQTPYELVRLVSAKGTKADVYEARHIETGARFAVRLDRADRMEINRNHDIMKARLPAHPNVVSFYDSGVVSFEGAYGPVKRTYQIYELIPGRDIEDRLKENYFASIGAARTAVLIEQIAAGLGHLYENGVYAGDHHYAGVMITDDDRAVVIDIAQDWDPKIDLGMGAAGNTYNSGGTDFRSYGEAMMEQAGGKTLSSRMGLTAVDAVKSIAVSLGKVYQPSGPQHEANVVRDPGQQEWLGRWVKYLKDVTSPSRSELRGGGLEKDPASVPFQIAVFLIAGQPFPAALADELAAFLNEDPLAFVHVENTILSVSGSAQNSDPLLPGMRRIAARIKEDLKQFIHTELSGMKEEGVTIGLDLSALGQNHIREDTAVRAVQTLLQLLRETGRDVSDPSNGLVFTGTRRTGTLITEPLRREGVSFTLAADGEWRRPEGQKYLPLMQLGGSLYKEAPDYVRGILLIFEGEFGPEAEEIGMLIQAAQAIATARSQSSEEAREFYSHFIKAMPLFREYEAVAGGFISYSGSGATIHTGMIHSLLTGLAAQALARDEILQSA